MSLVKIYGTGNFLEMPLGTVYHEPKDMADVLVSMGAASHEEVKEKQETAPQEKKQVTPTPKKKK